MRIFLYILFILFFACPAVYGQEGIKPCLLVSVIQDPPVLTSLEAIQELIDYAKKAQTRILFVQIYRANQAWFSSTLANDTPYKNAFQRTGVDPFAFLIEQGHAANIKVYAWVNLLSLSTNKDAVLLKKYGLEVLTRNTKPKSTIADYKIDNQYFLEPGDLRVREYLGGIVEEIAVAYPQLDGFLLDYIRYPDVKPAYGYSEANIKRFKEATGVDVFDERTESWRKWKRDQVTSLVREIAQKARAIHPDIGIAATGCVSYSRAYMDSFQDWPLWINSGLVDFVELMNYPSDVGEYQKYINEAKEKVKDFSRVYMGLGAYKLLKSPDVFLQQLTVAKDSGAGAVVVFHYGDLLESPRLAEILSEFPADKQ